MSRYEMLQHEYEVEGQKFQSFGLSSVDAVNKVARGLVAYLGLPESAYGFAAPQGHYHGPDPKAAARFVSKDTMAVVITVGLNPLAGSELPEQVLRFVLAVKAGEGEKDWTVTFQDKSRRIAKADLSAIEVMRLPESFCEAVYEVIAQAFRDTVQPNSVAATAPEFEYVTT